MSSDMCTLRGRSSGCRFHRRAERSNIFCTSGPETIPYLRLCDFYTPRNIRMISKYFTGSDVNGRGLQLTWGAKREFAWRDWCKSRKSSWCPWLAEVWTRDFRNNNQESYIHNIANFGTYLYFSVGIYIYMPIPVAARSKGVGLRPLWCWDSVFESHRGHGWLSVVSVVSFQVEISATSWSPVQRSPTEFGDSLLCDIETPWVRRPWSIGGLSRQKQTNIYTYVRSVDLCT
jgi:hypothetical protein